MRVSFTGDIMCELPTLRKSMHKGRYDFNGILSSSSVFDKTDYLIGNLETVFAGEDAGYSRDIYSYNSPDSFADEVKRAGFNLVSTANNHCLDRGVDGLKRTIEVLKNNKIEFVGTTNGEDNDYKIIDIDGIKLGILAYTYGSNYQINHVKLKENENYVNFFEVQKWNEGSSQSFSRKLKEKYLSREIRVKLLRMIGKIYNRERIDSTYIGLLSNKLKKDIQNIKDKCDYVIMLMHSGGQFNNEPGIYTRQLNEKLHELGIDFVIGNHPHVVQRMDTEPYITAYSLGNFFISPSTIYLLNKNLPTYSIVLHIDFDANKNYSLSFSIVVCIDINSKERVVNTYDLYQQVSNQEKDEISENCRVIFNRFLGLEKSEFYIQKEYQIV